MDQFDDARTATSPSTVGAAMEQPVRQQLEQILPRGIGVGSGFVIDSTGGTSRQTDIVLYEKDICPVFSINDTPETTYYPCEGVIATGEVKSILNRKELRDAFEKISSVKELRRFAVHEFMPHPTDGSPMIAYRNYGNLHNHSGIVKVNYEHLFRKESQIFGFLVAGKCPLKLNTLNEAFLELSSQVGDSLSPNMVAILDGGLLKWGKFTDRHFEKRWNEKSGSYVMREERNSQIRWEPVFSAQDADSFSYSQETDSFRSLIRWLREIYRTGITSDSKAFDQYFRGHTASPSVDCRYILKSGGALEEHLRQFGGKRKGPQQ